MAAAFGVGPGVPRYGERRHGDDTDRKRGRLLGDYNRCGRVSSGCDGRDRAARVMRRREGRRLGTTGVARVVREAAREVSGGGCGPATLDRGGGWRAQRRRGSGVTAAAASQRTAAIWSTRRSARPTRRCGGASSGHPWRVWAHVHAWRQSCARWWRSPPPCTSMSTRRSGAAVSLSGVGLTAPGRRARRTTPPRHRPPGHTRPPRRARDGGCIDHRDGRGEGACCGLSPVDPRGPVGAADGRGCG